MTARRELDLGRLMIAVGLLGFGALTLIYDDFGLNWQRVPDWVAARGLLAYVAGAIEVAVFASPHIRVEWTATPWPQRSYAMLN